MMCKAYDDGGWERERETFEVWDQAIVDREYEKGSIWWLLHNNTS